MSPLEFGLASEAVPRLRRHPLLAALTQGRPRRAREHAVYYDAPDLALARAGLALSVRRAGRVQLQRVVRLDASGRPTGAPADTVLADAAPDVERIPDDALRAAVAASLAGRALAPAWEVDLVREVRVLREDANELELVLHAGSVQTPQGPAPICTVALDTRGGEPGYAEQLALELLETLPLRATAAHPAARARALLLREHAQPRRAEPIDVPADATVEALLVAVVESCLRQIVGNEEAAALGADPEGVHQLRVGLRRLRSALSFFADVLPDRQRRELRDALGALASELGPARDLDVFTLEWLEPALSARPDDEALARLAAVVRERRAEAARRVAAVLASDRFPRLVLEIRRWIARSAWRDQPLTATSAQLFLPAGAWAAAHLARRHRKVRKAMKHVASATPAERHELRIRAKKLRYAAEFTAPLFAGHAARRYAKRLAGLQDALGVANDATVADALAIDLATALGNDVACVRAAGFLAGWSAHAAHECIEALPERVRRFAKAPAYWKDGR